MDLVRPGIATFAFASIRAIAQIATATFAVVSLANAYAGPCGDVERARAILANGFAGEKSRKDGPVEYLEGGMFGDDACIVARPWVASTKRSVTCMLGDYSGGEEEIKAFAKMHFLRLAGVLDQCLASHAPFDNTANENPDDEVFDRRHYRSSDGRETWSLTFQSRNLPSTFLRIEYETEDASAQSNATMPEFLQNVLTGSECQTFSGMEKLARANFAGAEVKRVRTESALVTPMGGATECLVARDRMRNENVIACNWLREDAEHAKWAEKIQAIRLGAARKCRKGWTETQTRFGAKFENSAGDILTVEKRSADEFSMTGVAVRVKYAH